MDILGGFLAGLGVLLFVLMAIGILSYVLFAVGLHTVGERHGVDNAYFAWIPILQYYVLGAVIDHVSIFGQKIDELKWILPGLSVATFILGGVPVLGTLIAIATLVISIVALHKFLEMQGSSSPIGVIVASLFIPLVLPIVVFNLRHN